MSRSLKSAVATDAPPKLFYGWVVVGVCFLILGLSMGSTQYLVGVLAGPFAAEFSAGRAAVLFSTASVMAIAGGMASPFLGAWLQRASARKAMLLAIGAMGIGFILLSVATALWQVAAIYALALAFGTGATNLGANMLAATWFTAKRGRALGLTAAGMSAFGFVLPPLATQGIAELGWRPTCLIVGLVLLAALPLIGWLLVDKPAQRGLYPDGASSAGVAVIGAEAPVRWTVRALLACSSFWLIVLPIGLCLATAVTLLNNLMLLAVDLGIAADSAAYLASLVALSALVGKLADVVGPRSLVWIPLGLAISACLIIHGASAYPRLAVAATLLGLAFGAATPAWSALVAATFGTGSFTLAMGLMTPVVSVLLASCIPFAGWVRDLTGSYDVAWLVLAAAMAAMVVAVWRLPGTTST
jgi:MFS family permease